jgi:hypothetical protein
MESALDGNFELLDDSQDKRDIKPIGHRWEKCIEFKGDDLETQRYVFFLQTLGVFFAIKKKVSLGGFTN